MNFHYLLWASGPDRPGFVAAISEILFRERCNLEDSSMMRLGSEFAMFLILASDHELSKEKFSNNTRTRGLIIGLKKISKRQARFVKPNRSSYMVRVHGRDRKGIVLKVTKCLARHRFNITDLATHRTGQGSKAGYILLLEGELPRASGLKRLSADLSRIGRRLGTQVSIDLIQNSSI